MALGALTIAAGLTHAYLWREAIGAGTFKAATFYSLPVAALLLFTILFALSSAFVRHHLARTTTAILAVGAGFSLAPYNSVTLSTLGIAAIGGWYASSAIASEAASSAVFGVRRIFRGGLPAFFTAVALLLAALYFGFLNERSDGETVPKTIFDALIPLVAEPLQPILPGFRSDATVDELLLAFAGAQSGVNPADLAPPEREALIRESREALERELGIELAGNERGADLLYRLTSAQIEKLLGPFRAYLPFIAAFGFFVTVKALTWPLYWTALLLLWAVVQLLMRAEVLHQRNETVQVTRIEL